MTIIRGTGKLFNIIRTVNGLSKAISDSERAIIACTLYDSTNCKIFINVLLEEQEKFNKYMSENRITPYCIDCSNMDLSRKLDVREFLPDIKIYKNGNMIEEVCGLMPFELFKKHLSKAYNLKND